MIRHAFNIAACLAGSALATTETLLVGMVMSPPPRGGGWLNLYPTMTGTEIAMHTAIGIAGAGLFLLGYNRVIGNGKTLNAVRTLVHKIDTPKGP